MFLNRFNGIIFNERKFIQTPPSMPSVVFWNLGAATNFFLKISKLSTLILFSYYHSIQKKWSFETSWKWNRSKNGRNAEEWNTEMAYISLLSWGNSLRSWIRWWMLSWSPTCMLWQWLPLSPTWTMLIKAYQILFKIQVEGKIEINYVQLLFRCNSFFSWKLM